MKKFIALLMMVVILVGVSPCAFGMTQYYYDGEWHNYSGNTFNLRVNGEVLNTEVPPIVFGGYSVVPAREVFEKMGALVEWNGSTRTVYISNDKYTLTLNIDSNVCYKGHMTMKMPIAPKIINGKTMVPVRAVCDMLEYQVGFDSTTDTVTVDKKAQQAAVPNGKIAVSNANYSLQGSRIILTVGTAGMATYNAFYVSNPLRLVVDITNGYFVSLPGDIAVNSSTVSSIRFGNPDGARIVFDVSQEVSYNVQTSANSIVIMVETTTALSQNSGNANSGNTNNSIPSFIQTPTEEFYLNVEASGGRDYLRTNAQITNASRLTSPDRIEVSLSGSNLSTAPSEKNVGGNFVQSMKYTPSSSGSATVTLYVKDGNYNFIQSQGEFYVMAQNTANPRSIMIDVGHGGHDSGAVGYDANGNPEAYEKDLNLDVALRLRAELQKYNVEVHMIRENDTYVDFRQVGAIANDAGTTLFVSIHTNSATASSANGIETWAYLESNATSLNGMNGRRLAEIIQNELIYVTKAADRGVKNGKSLAVIRTTQMPAVLVEMGFISNESDRHKLMDANYRQQIAEAIAMGVLVAFKEMGI